MSKPNGGPAYPVVYLHDTRDGISYREWAGMTLRDRFAESAAMGLCSGIGLGVKHENVGALAYKVADQMMESRGSSDAT